NVTAHMKQSGTSVMNKYRVFCILIRIVVHRQSAITESSWFASPKSGQSVLMPPSGSTTPSYKNQPHAATSRTLEKKFAVHDRVFPSGRHTIHNKTSTKNRPTRLPAIIPAKMTIAS